MIFICWNAIRRKCQLFCPGHNLNQQLKRNFKNKDNYIIEDIIPENNKENTSV